MFSRIKDPSGAISTMTSDSTPKTYIQRKTFEQVELEQMWLILSEMRDEINTLRKELTGVVREELRSQHSKFQTWEDLNKIAENNKIKERELEIRDGNAQDLTILYSKILNLVSEMNTNKSPIQKTTTNDNEGNDQKIEPPSEEVDGGV